MEGQNGNYIYISADLTSILATHVGLFLTVHKTNENSNRIRSISRAASTNLIRSQSSFAQESQE